MINHQEDRMKQGHHIRTSDAAPGRPREAPYLARLELWGLAVEHVHGFDAVLQHADGPVEHSHQVAGGEEENT